MGSKCSCMKPETNIGRTNSYNLRSRTPSLTNSLLHRDDEVIILKDHEGSSSISGVDKLLTEYTRPVSSPPEELCSICMVSLQQASGLCEVEEETEENTTGNTSKSQDSCDDGGAVQLVHCNHIFHFACVKQMVETFPKYLRCPYCKNIHGVREGNQPPGKMKTSRIRRSLPGHSDCGTIIIEYSFQNGTQGPEHPNPGEMYTAFGFPRIAFLPDSYKGNKVLKFLQEAWRRRLIFTVGTSMTTGLHNVITWNDIHHKTNCLSNVSGHGYPDEFYLDSVLMELENAGVTDVTT
ncbi:probable E3 ubiquitin-protein ligase DTX2 isoform X2 [Homarus americanus]|uniref:probable E3 ubiquitin-protein ligase DTX2 isoform X2 n=1 Tax=Homarus americanus TaxID=6706 RepID=UPI001C452668|nr:probable E3 ubiquitin-protein ligase DTX2 isoform X2 [Homarus americanus]